MMKKQQCFFSNLNTFADKFECHIKELIKDCSPHIVQTTSLLDLILQYMAYLLLITIMHSYF